MASWKLLMFLVDCESLISDKEILFIVYIIVFYVKEGCE